MSLPSQKEFSPITVRLTGCKAAKNSRHGEKSPISTTTPDVGVLEGRYIFIASRNQTLPAFFCDK